MLGMFNLVNKKQKHNNLENKLLKMEYQTITWENFIAREIAHLVAID
jgi:hypothetical protein